MRDAFAEAMAALVSKLSPSAQLRRREITDQLRALILESLDISITEARRLLAKGKDCADALTSFLLVRQQIETQDIRNLAGVGLMKLELEAGKVDDARQYFSREAQSKKKELQGQIVALAVEDLELMERELWRLGLETDGQQGKDYTEASFLVRTLREQMQTQGDPIDAKPSGLLGMLIEAASSSAENEVQKHSQGN